MAGRSAQKQVRASERRRVQNKSIRSELKTNISKAEKLIFSNELDAAKEAARAASVSLDKAAEKQTIHRNNAARRKSRLMKKLNGAAASAKAASEPKGQAE